MTYVFNDIACMYDIIQLPAFDYGVDKYIKRYFYNVDKSIYLHQIEYQPIVPIKNLDTLIYAILSENNVLLSIDMANALYIKLECHGNDNINPLPKKLLYFEAGFWFHTKINIFPIYLVYLILSRGYMCKIENIPVNLQYFNIDYKYRRKFNNTLQYLTYTDAFDHFYPCIKNKHKHLYLLN